MADPVLHIKDSYYFEVPKVLWPSTRNSRDDFPEVWISLDPEFQHWEFDRLYEELTALDAGLPPEEQAHEDWHHFQHGDHANHGKPFDVFLEEMYQGHVAKFNEWKTAQVQQAEGKQDGAAVDDAEKLTFDDYLEHLKTTDAADTAYAGFLDWREEHENPHLAAGVLGDWLASKVFGPPKSKQLEQARTEAGDIKVWKEPDAAPEWSKAKIAGYNEHLSGKILIPQPFGTLRNLYEKESGFAISKYMVLQLVIGLVLLVIFANVAKKIRAGGPPRGYVWNLLEAFLLFIRNDIVAPSVGGHHEEHPEHEKEHGHEFGSPYGEHGEALTAHGKPDHGHVEHDTHLGGKPHAHAHDHNHGPSDVTRLVPLFWTIFFFVLFCNLFGMLPWMGAPTASFSVTTGLALVTLVVGMIAGISKFGFLGYLGNQIPAMDLPLYIAVVVKPLVYAIEVMGLMIKHGVLAIRLLANMVAGHLVILGIMGVAFGATAATAFGNSGGWQWWVAAVIAVLASTAFNLLELFVAFLQAYIFTFLSALFIGASMHKH